MELLCAGPAYLDACPEQFENNVAEVCARRIPRRAVMRQLKALHSSRMDPADYSIRCPTLVIAGEQDHLIPAFYARRMADQIPGSEFVLIPGAGHSLVKECPQVVLTSVIAFLEGKAREAGHEQCVHWTVPKRACSPKTVAPAAQRSGGSL
jgi:pimeloyl-ACP methyl ester carboxylesterase